MRKMINIAFLYAGAAMAGGVFYREFTKYNGFTQRTSLAFVHTHLFVLGMLVFMVVGLYASKFKLNANKRFKVFLITYNIGVPLTGIMLFVRGLVQVLGTNISKGADASISGIAGIGHILTGIGLVFLLISLRECEKE